MDVALSIEMIVPQADYQGSVNGNTQDEFDAIRWNDSRPKPSWNDLLTLQDQVKSLVTKQNFDPKKAFSRCGQVFSIDRKVALSPFDYTIRLYMESKNFPELKDFFDALVTAGIAISKDRENIKSIFLEQNIDIDKL